MLGLQGYILKEYGLYVNENDQRTILSTLGTEVMMGVTSGAGILNLPEHLRAPPIFE